MLLLRVCLLIMMQDQGQQRRTEKEIRKKETRFSGQDSGVLGNSPRTIS